MRATVAWSPGAPFEMGDDGSIADPGPLRFQGVQA
jgi:hypothetical protein